MFVGRVAIEKNLDAFLSLNIAGTKIVVGDGPQLKELKAKFPETVFVGFLSGEPLAQHLAAADVFVFPSLTDTFGIVLLDALASGIPVECIYFKSHGKCNIKPAWSAYFE
jgi:glycosyltransferase involved in cell wall biosynthesis